MPKRTQIVCLTGGAHNKDGYLHSIDPIFARAFIKAYKTELGSGWHSRVPDGSVRRQIKTAGKIPGRTHGLRQTRWRYNLNDSC